MKKNALKVIITPLLLLFSLTAFAGNLYVAPSGSDNSAGTLSDPYKTIGKAASVAAAGDTVYIREGTYEEVLRPANSGTATDPIVFRSYRDEKVIISAMQALSSWTLDSGSVYKTTVNWNLGQGNFVMNNETALDLARWPNNIDQDPFTLNSLRNTGGSGEDVGKGAYIDYAEGIPDIDWSNGGSVFFFGDRPGSGWLAWREFITSNTDTRINIDLSKKNPIWIRTFHDPASGGDFFLQGVRGALDYQNEWYYNPTSKTLYVQLPEGAAPVDGQVRMRRRSKTIDLANRSYIEIRDLSVFGGSIEMTGKSNNNIIYGLSSFYGNTSLGVNKGFMASSYSVNVTGNNNTVERSEIAYGSGSGYRDTGNNNKLLNSYVHHFNTLGDYNAVVVTRGGGNALVKNNILSYAGRATIQASKRDSEYAYNDISYANLIADDAGLFYTLNGPQRVTIHHNWFHEAYSRGALRKSCGIYLDNNSHSFSVHHNVIWNTEWAGIQINLNGTNIDVFNNTMWNNSSAMGAWHREGTAFSDVRVWNNLSDGGEWETQSDLQNNVTANGDPFMDSIMGDFTLKADTSPINAGRVIDGITSDFAGSAPDAGAYEFGGALWIPGITWNKENGPANRCYDLPGEKCTAIPAIALVPGKIEAEDYNNYEDTTPTNLGGQYRNDGVDIGVTSDTGGGYNIGWIADGEWLEYDIDVIEAGQYKVDVRVASRPGGGAFKFQVDGVDVGTTINVESTSAENWQTFVTKVVSIGALSEGIHTVRLNVISAGFNLNWLSFKIASTIPTPPGDNLLSNGDFETGDTSGWSGYGTRTVTADAASGSNAGQVTGAGAFSQELTGLTPNTSYVYTANVKVNSGGSAVFGVKDYGDAEKGNTITATSYQKSSLSFTTGTNSTSARLYFYVAGAGDVAFIDNASLVPEGADPVNLVANPGFETGNLNDWAGWGGPRAAVSDNADTGSYAASVQGAGAMNQVISNLKPDTAYVLSANTKVNAGDKAILGVKNHGDAENSVNVISPSYQTSRLTFTTSASANSAQIYYYVAAANNLGFIDEVSVVEQ